MTKVFSSGAISRDDVRLARSSKFSVEVRVSKRGFNLANRFFNGSQSPIPDMTADAGALFVSSRERAWRLVDFINRLASYEAGRLGETNNHAAALIVS